MIRTQASEDYVKVKKRSHGKQLEVKLFSLSAQSQHVETDVTNSDGFLKIVFDNWHLLITALGAK